MDSVMPDLDRLPGGLPAPTDDGAADHLSGRLMPDLTCIGTSGRSHRLDELGAGTTVLYVYPMTGRPKAPLPDGWDGIPGARGCTPEACGFRDHHRELLAAGASSVFGLSSQTSEYQREAVDRLHLPYELLSDPALALAAGLALPTFETPSHGTFYRRLTLVIHRGRIEKFFYPVFPPDRHADEVLAWLQA